MNITVTVIDHNDQRYSTCGDWVFEGDDLHIYISKMGDWRYETLVAIHEIAEVVLCKERGISQKAVDKFDIEFEKNRQDGDESEPGDCVDAPYQNEHSYATGIERILCAALGIKWDEYACAVENLFFTGESPHSQEAGGTETGAGIEPATSP